MKDFVIAYGSLKDGKHDFNFEIGNTLFDFFNYTDLTAVDVAGSLELEKEKTMLTLNFGAVGEITTNCDRCNKKLALPIDCNQQVLVKFSGMDIQSKSEEIIYMSPNDVEIDVALHFYEMLVLSLPLKKMHDTQQCEDDMLSFIDQINKKEKEEMDPRWDALKKLK